MKKSLQNQQVIERVKSSSLSEDLVSILAVLILIAAGVYYGIEQIHRYQEKGRSSGYGEGVE